MDDTTRRRLAFLAACKSGLAPTSVYSFETGRHTNMEAGPAFMIDHGTATRFTDSYDEGRKANWTFALNGGEFSGYDYGSGDHYDGKISDRSIQIYDHGEGRYFDYSV